MFQKVIDLVGMDFQRTDTPSIVIIYRKLYIFYELLC